MTQQTPQQDNGRSADGDSSVEDAGEELPADLGKAEASEHNDRLRAATGQH